MPSAPVFVDTNILVYAHDRAAGRKHEIARNKIISLWEEPMPPVVSGQVLQELYVTLIRKHLAAKDVREFVTDYMQWRVIANDASLIREGISITERWKVSFWDGLILAAALRANVAEVWTEDLNEGQDYGGVRVVNPFRESF